ncbi:hypothetical protein BJX61DRAFT_546289 [Aspergillus egyptiacus]|nr:hypothetical protein BJX61DRAFT_546289 [Aspergillus egyptiacus]
MHMLSPDGRSHSFDSRANGYARGEALAAIIVKPLRQALADGDTIRAVIRGSGANQDGKTVGITIPNGNAQADLIRTTYATAGLGLEQTGYFEAHGTGTPVGDPIELSAIGGSFGALRSHDNPLIVGSVKTNIGHTEGAAGLAGVIKTVLALENGVIPPLADFKELNERLLLDEWKLALPLEKAVPWPTTGLRRASVNSFGFGGANAHLILDDAYHYLQARGLEGQHRTLVNEDEDSSDSGLELSSDRSDRGDDQSHKLFVFSAYDGTGIKRTATSWGTFLTNHLSSKKVQDENIAIDDLTYTLSNRRTTFDFRSFAVASSLRELSTKITQDGLPKLNRTSRRPNPIFVFTGQGAQWPAMGRELLSNSVFRASIEKSRSVLEKVGCKWEVLELLSDPTDRRIDTPAFSQPVCTIVQVALVDLLRSWGIEPGATVGHSSGEVAAAYAAKLLSLDDAVRIGYWRGFYSEQVKDLMGDRKGAMMAVGLSETQSRAYLSHVPEGSAVVACVNSPSSVTLSGDEGAISTLEKVISNDGHFARKLRVQVAYHSPHMKVVADPFVHAVGSIIPQASEIPMFSSVTEGKVEDPSALGAVYWMQNLISPVRFSGALTNLLDYSPGAKANARRRRAGAGTWSALVEIGPHEALKGPCRQIMSAWDAKSVDQMTYLSVLSRGKHAMETSLTAAGLLWASGHPVNLEKVNQYHTRQAAVSDLPPYPWNHDRGFWHEPAASTSARLRTEPRNDLLGMPVPRQNPFERNWQNYLSVAECPWQADHVITGAVLYPGAGHLIMAFEAALRLSAGDRVLKGVSFTDVHFAKGLVIPSGDQAVETLLATRPHEKLPEWYHYTLYSVNAEGSWTKHSWGTFSLHYDEDISAEQGERYYETYRTLQSCATRKIDIPSFYDQLQSIGTEYGPAFRNLISAAAVADADANGHSGIGTIAIPDTKSVMPHEFEYPHLIHPATLDAIFHLIFVAMGQGNPLSESAIPTKIDKVFVSTDQPSGVGAKYTGYGRAEPVSGRDTQGIIAVFADERFESGPKIIVEGMTVTEVSSGASSGASSSGSLLSSPGEKGRIATLTWKEDLDTLVGQVALDWLNRQPAEVPSTESAALQHLDGWLELAMFKNTDWRVMFVNPSSNSLNLLKKYGPTEGGRYRFAHTSVVEATAEAAERTQDTLAQAGLKVSSLALDLAGIGDETLADLGAFDLIITESCEIAQAVNMKALLRQEGRVALISPDTTVLSDIPGLQRTVAFSSAEDSSSLWIGGLDPPHTLTSNDVDEILLLQHADPAPSTTELAKQLTTRLRTLGIPARTISLPEAASVSRRNVISLLEADRPFVISWTAEEFEQFRQLTSARYLLWITRGGLLKAEEVSLAYAPSTGLLRTVRVEKPQIRLPHLDLSPNLDLSSSRAADLILSVLSSSIKPEVHGKNPEMEYAEQDGLLYIPRAQGQAALDHELAVHAETVTSVPGPLHKPGVPRQLEALRVGDVSSLRWIPEERSDGKLADHQVEIQVSHVSLEQSQVRDFLSGKQRSSLPELGRALVGRVTEVGVGVSKFLPGDKVITLQSDAFHTHVRTEESVVHRVPVSLSPAEAAHLPLAAAYAWHTLVDTAGFRAGQSVFINGADGSLGQLVIQLAQLLKGEVFASVDSEAEKRSLVEAHGVPSDHVVLLSQFAAWGSVLQSATGGRGLDIIINNTTAGLPIRTLSACVAAGGRFVDITQQLDPSLLDPKVFQQNVCLSILNWSSVSGREISVLIEKVLGLVQTGALHRTQDISIFPVSELQRALSTGRGPLREAESMVIEFSSDAVVPLLAAPPEPLHLKGDGAYILAGGLGALGLTIADNLCIHGAAHLVFLSRSGASNLRQQEALQRFRDRGCRVDVVKCDVTDSEQVQAFAAQIQEESWNVRGIVQLAMVLRDSIFENMTFEKWTTAVNPKIKGTWNLHSYLPKDLDFFIILSSLSGIMGNTAQANYCAGNTYEDALAHYRQTTLGLTATTLNVGLVTDASHFNEDSTIEDYLRKYSHWIPAQVSDIELQRTLLAVMRGTLPGGEPVPGQLLVGLSDQVRRDGDSLNLWPMDRKFDHRISLEVGVAGEKELGQESDKQKLQAATTVTEAQAVVEGALRVNVAGAMTASPDDIDVEKPLYAFGIDSLKAIEVRNWIFSELKADISVFEVLSPVPLARLAMKIVSKSTLVGPEMAAEAVAESTS